MHERSLASSFLALNERIWPHLPRGATNSRLVQHYARWLHSLVTRHADREMYLGTQFLRNRPALELMRRLTDSKRSGSTLHVTVLGCSIGAEVYSILWTLRRARPDLEIVMTAVDVSTEVLEFAQQGVYGPETVDMVGATIFERLDRAELDGMFDWEGEHGVVKPWLREGIRWYAADACDPGLRDVLEPQDIVVASNFLCHMDPKNAERCLRNLARLGKTDGYLFVTGVDLDIRTRVALDLGWRPLSDLIDEIHDGDPLVRADWPFRWWGLEPLDRNKANWEVRYANAFQLEAVDLS